MIDDAISVHALQGWTEQEVCQYILRDGIIAVHTVFVHGLNCKSVFFTQNQHNTHVH